MMIYHCMEQLHLAKYEELTDSVITRDRLSGQPRGFEFVTYAATSVMDKVEVDLALSGGLKQRKNKQKRVAGLNGA
jgi:hypothetical protein